MADYIVKLGPAKEAVLRYYFATVDEAIADILDKRIMGLAGTVIERETDYRGNLSEAKKAVIIAALAKVPTLEERKAAIAEEDIN